MKLRKLVRKLDDFLDADARERKEHRDEMKALLRKMKDKEKSLSARALAEFDENKRSALRKQIEMVHAQRKKGIDALKKLSAQRKR